MRPSSWLLSLSPRQGYVEYICVQQFFAVVFLNVGGLEGKLFCENKVVTYAIFFYFLIFFIAIIISCTFDEIKYVTMTTVLNNIKNYYPSHHQ